MKSSLRNIISGIGQLQTLILSASTLQAGKILSVTGASGSLDALVIAAIHDQSSRPLAVVAHDGATAERIKEDLERVKESSAIRLFGGRNLHGAAVSVEEIETLRSLALGTTDVLVVHPRALQQILPDPASIDRQTIHIKVNEEYNLEQISKQLINLGFEKKEFVETFGDYALRGGILDVYPFIGENPVRVEFFGETVESIREFDPFSQRSIKELVAAAVVPNFLQQTDDRAVGYNSSIFDYLKPDTMIVIENPELLATSLYGEREKTGHTTLTAEEVLDLIALFPQIHIRSTHSEPASIDLNSKPQPAFNGSIKLLRANVSELTQSGYRVIMTCESQPELIRLKDMLTVIEEELPADGPTVKAEPDTQRITFSLEAIHSGFILPGSQLAVYTEHQVFNRLKRSGKKRRPKFRGLAEKELNQLRKGDYVVHVDHGIGRFDGLKKIKVLDLEQEVVKLLYDEKDTLYVNLNYLGKVQKYSSKEGHVPCLTRLGRGEWEKLRTRAKKKIKDIARELVKLYALRKHEEGFAFESDTPWQRELEASFMYDDTFDQAKATRDVKQDMEAPYPMDRLICGDVGFGKTEVAVRAAFKAVLSGKQVAVLVPTTILAAQHFNTFKDRMSRYSTNVQVLSRFKSKTDQVRIIEQLRAGTIDIVIGTHRLLSKDIGFRDLGLLIVDEEHRFGVSAKEKLRQLKANVDSVSLTATPIPRTLHFSLLGVRDLSIIATPPRNRLPIITEITQFNEDLIREAVLREVQRGGQVYFVHDRVQDIESFTDRVRSIVPGVRFRYAHGQMPGHELEKVMLDFLERKFDVLVSTKIIESGLDIPNVNTMIVNRADRFGMAELYQLRGRVGRSNIQAYAYLLTPPISILPRKTLLRLQAVEEFTELSSGFNLAMRDLEIRGAGNLLGAEQSGFIDTMGFETYTRILEEAVSELKQEEFRDYFKDEVPAIRLDNTAVEVGVASLIPDSYVESSSERLEVYRRLYSVNTTEQINEISDELRDRFGPHPVEVENLFAAVKLRLAGSKQGFRKIIVSQERLTIEFPPPSDTRFYEGEVFQSLMRTLSRMGNRIHASQTGKTPQLIAALRSQKPLDEALVIINSLSNVDSYKTEPAQV